MIRLSLLEMEGRDAISLSGRENLIQKILGLPRKTSSILILIDWSTITADSSSVPHTRQGRVLSTRGELMWTSCPRPGAGSIEYTSGGDALVFYGFRLDLFQALLIADVLTLFVFFLFLFFCGRLVPHRLFSSSPLL